MYRVKRLEHIRLVIVFAALNMLDPILTNIIINNGGNELNPLMRYLWEQPRWTLWTVEIGSTVVIALAFLLLATYLPRFIKVVLIVSIIYMAGVCLWNGVCLLRAFGFS